MQNRVLSNMMLVAALLLSWNADIKAMVTQPKIESYIQEMNALGKDPEKEAWYSGQHSLANAIKLYQERKKNDHSEDNSRAERRKRAALLQAADKGDLNAVAKLVNDGVYINGDYEKNSMTPLMAAANKGHINVVRFLVNEGADFGRSVDGKTAADYARENGHKDVAATIEEGKWVRIGKARRRKRAAKKEKKLLERTLEEEALAGLEEEDEEEKGDESSWAGVELVDPEDAFADSLAID